MDTNETLMSNETLVKRFNTRSASRKRFLFLKFSSLIFSNAPAQMVADKINHELAVENLVQPNDIYYCRRYFLKKKNSKLASELQHKANINPDRPKAHWQSIKWY